MVYRYATLRVAPKTGGVDAIARCQGIEKQNTLFLGRQTLGIEVTDPELEKGCGLGNIDPQHRRQGSVTQAAVEAAMAWPLPAPDSLLVTIRHDLDAVGAMALLTLRAEGVAVTDGIAGRVASIGAQDRFDHGPWPGPMPMPQTREDFIAAVGAGGPLAPLNAMVRGGPSLLLADRVALAKAWLMTGQFPGEPEYRKEALAFAEKLERAFRSGETRAWQRANGRIAFVEGTAQGALTIAYRLAPVVVGNCSPPVTGGSMRRKHRAACETGADGSEGAQAA
jgi:hypothetical protein